jgi:hypothetical protein
MLRHGLESAQVFGTLLLQIRVEETSIYFIESFFIGAVRG